MKTENKRLVEVSNIRIVDFSSLRVHLEVCSTELLSEA